MTCLLVKAGRGILSSDIYLISENVVRSHQRALDHPFVHLSCVAAANLVILTGQIMRSCSHIIVWRRLSLEYFSVMWPALGVIGKFPPFLFFPFLSFLSFPSFPSPRPLFSISPSFLYPQTCQEHSISPRASRQCQGIYPIL